MTKPESFPASAAEFGLVPVKLASPLLPPPSTETRLPVPPLPDDPPVNFWPLKPLSVLDVAHAAATITLMSAEYR